MTTEAEKRKQREDDERRRRNDSQPVPLFDNSPAWSTPTDSGSCSDSGGSCGGGE